MNTVFSFRLDSETSEKLRLLALATHRSRGNVIRWLIHHAEARGDLSLSKLPSNDIPRNLKTKTFNDEMIVGVKR